MTITSQMIIRTTPERVLEAFMQTRHTRAWWQDCQAFFDLDARSFSWQWRAPDGAFLYITHGTITAHAAGLFLQLDNIWQYDFTAKRPLGPAGLLIECTPQVNDTLLVVKHHSPDTNAPEWVAYNAAVQEGWQAVLPALRDYLEGKGS